MSLFRFKMWWMTQRMGNCGQEIPFETQFLLIEAHKGCDIEGGIDNGEQDQDGSTYAVLLPLLEGDFRAVLQGNDQNEIEICVESGMYSSNNTTDNHKFVSIFCLCKLCSLCSQW